MSPGFEIADFASIPPNPCPCGLARRAFADLADFVSVEGGEGLIGHSYFLSNPSVRADLTAIVRDHRKVDDRMRALVEIRRPFWYLPNH